MKFFCPRMAAAFACLVFLVSGVRADDDRDALVIYPAFGDSRAAVIEGRVIEDRGSAAHRDDAPWWRNLWRNARLMVNSEREHARVRLDVAGRAFDVRTDEEGYFSQAVAGMPALAPGWHTVRGQVGDVAADGRLLVVPAENTIGVISDLDDTLLVTEVNSKRALLTNTFLKNPRQRQAVAGAAQFIRNVAARNPQPAAAPVIYLSASPRQLQANILDFLDHNGFPPGVLLTKRVTNDRTSDPLADQVAYKSAKLEGIFARLPHVRFVLMGDDGERDPEIYQQLREKYPLRVEKILIRRVNPDPARRIIDGQVDLTAAINGVILRGTK
ncbi:phosphatase domain-containing protein [Janthinobacterium sp. 17J80-10]|uniref:phosphatase domain-containing protein n=1 Tax=Janthinobacterium sp. 17J80-10 TaxID=2497863 RepID=UPI0010058643|nr:phosphatase domain-containing protein [Janthinobacterium sp. 17J80-10]QAU32820.1 DUF2183 domain-containing protein [Janthinobacterium sp. 17J80-10]